MKQSRKRLGILSLLIALLVLDGAAIIWAFAEEPLGFRDIDNHYYDPASGYPEISTVHDDLTFAMALAAGFSTADSHTLRIWNQLVDSEALPSSVVSYTFGNAGFSAPPDKNSVCGSRPHAQQVWPTNDFNSTTSSVTSRFGPYSPFFHFPRLDGWEIKSLHDWAWGISSTLSGYEAYAWGQVGVKTAFQAMDPVNGCAITRTAVISMPVQAGSQKAFATYLHSLGDSYSHAACMTALSNWSAYSILWGTHTVTTTLVNDPSIPACDYVPRDPTATDSHGEEFDGGAGAARTDAAIRAIFSELSLRSFQREGMYVPLPLTTTMTVSGTLTSLDDALTFFVHNFAFDQSTARRDYADKLVLAIQAQPRALIQRVYLPLIEK